MSSDELQKSKSRRIIGVLTNLLGWLGSLFFLILIWKQAAAVDWAVITVEWNNLILAFVLLFVGQALQSQLCWITQNALGYAVGPMTIHRVWFFSQIAKYIPGSLWQIAARTAFYLQQGVPLGIGSAATLWELVATIAGSLVIGTFSFMLGPDRYWLALGALLLVLLSVAFYMRWPWRLLVSLRICLARRMIDALAQVNERTGMTLNLFLLSAGVWLIVGVGFYFLAHAFGVSSRLTVWNAIVIFNVAYSVGFLVIVAPSGLGVREVVLSLFLAPYFPPLTLAAFILIARLWWISAEGINVLIAGVGKLLERRILLKAVEE